MSNKSDYDKLYPNITDKDLGAVYRLFDITVYMNSSGMTEFSIYTSDDGENFNLLENCMLDALEYTDGVKIDGKNVCARYIRVFSQYSSNSDMAYAERVDFNGERVNLPIKEEPIINIEVFQNSEFNIQITHEDTISEVYGIISRNIGEKYCDWFMFELASKTEFDYFTLQNFGNKIKITANSGVCLACGLNYYLKNFCKVHISQVGVQVKMPDSIIPIDREIHRETKAKIRYAYNYCTHSYTMSFWGEQEWRRELDWLALNGVNAVLDITAQEEVWRRFLSKIGYSLDEIKRYIAGPAFYAWAYMANLFGHGGPIHNSWFSRRTALARENQLIMRKLGMSPILQGYSGMVPIDIEQYDTDAEFIPQGTWCNTRRPYMLKTVSPCFKKYADMFYSAQREVYGDVTKYFAADPFHEGGITGDMNPADVSSGVLSAMLNYNKDAVWVIQSWEGNPKSELLAGLDRVENGKNHAIVLDLYAEKQPHYNEGAPSNPSYGYSPEFDKTPWIFCMLNNFGGRLGLYGHLDNLVSGIPKALNDSKYNVGIGITPESSCNNPMLYDFVFDCIWQSDASKILPEIDVEKWLCDYCERRYGIKSTACENAMHILKNTVYSSLLNNLGQGAPEAISNARPALEIKAASTWGNSLVQYDNSELIKATRLLLTDYELLKNQDTYIYDVVSAYQQVLSNEIQQCHNKMREAYFDENAERFKQISDEFLKIIDCMETVTSCNEHYMLGTWIKKARNLSADTDDFTKMIFEMNAKQLITTWGSYHMAQTLHDYSNRQWSGMFSTFYKPRWEYWIGEIIKKMNGEHFDDNPDWFSFEWSWVRERRDFCEVPEKHDLKQLFEEYYK